MNDYAHVVDVGIETIARGEALKQLNHHIARAVENCLDPNTDPKADRTVTLRVKIKPDPRRVSADLTYAVDLKLPTDAQGSDIVHIRQRDGKGFVSKGEQMGLEVVDEETGEITKITERRQPIQ